MIRTWGAASSGITSGVGLAIAKTIASSFIFASESRLDDAGAGEADEEVHALDYVVGLPVDLLRVRVLRVPALGLVHLARLT